MSNYSIDSISITYDEMNINNHKPYILDKIEEYYYKVHDKKLKYKTVLELQKLIKRFPKVSSFYNYLMNAYFQLDKEEEAQRVLDKTVKAFPNYIFAIGKKTELLVKEGLIEEARALLKYTNNINELYPDRKEFHFTEVRTYYTAIFFIEAYDRNEDNAQAILEVIEILDEDLAHHLRLELLSIKIQQEDFLDDLDIIKPNAGRLYPLEYIKEPLTFNTKIIEQLLEKRLTIDLLKQLQSNDTSIIIDDLITLLRYISHNEDDFYNTENAYLAIDTLILLGYFKATKALEPLLEFLRGDSEFLDYHLGDFFTETLWQIIYTICDDNIDVLFSFLKEPRIDTWPKVAVNEAIVKIHQEEDTYKTVIEKQWIELLKFYSQHSEEQDIVDSSYFTMLINEIRISKTNKEFTDIVKSFFEKDWIDLHFNGDFEEWLEDKGIKARQTLYTEQIISYYTN